MSPGRRAVILALAATILLCSPALATRAWLPPVRLAPPAAVTEGADVGMDAAGNALAAWVRDGGVQIATRPVGGAWSQPRDFSPTGVDARDLSVNVNARGDVLVVWTEDLGTGARVARYRSKPLGFEFGGSGQMSDLGVSQLDVEMNAVGAAVVTMMREGKVEATVRAHADDNFRLPRTVSVGTNVSSPSAGIDDAGNAIVVWRHNVGDEVHVESSSFTAGTWSAVETIPGTVGIYTMPQVAVHASGRAAAMVYAQFTPEIGPTVRVAFRTSIGAPWGEATRIAYHEFPMGFQARYERDGTPLFFMGGGRVANAWQFYGGPPGDIVGLEGAEGYAESPPFGVAVSPAGGSVVYWAGRDGFKARYRPPTGPFGPIETTGVNATGTSGLALDDQGNGVLVWQDKQSGATWATALDAAPPTITDMSLPDTVAVDEPATMRVVATDRTTAVSASWRFSDGQTADAAETTRTFPLPGAHEVHAIVRDSAGNETRATRTITVIPHPIATTPPEPDNDGDGTRASLDCDDGNASIFPGAAERLGNALDENCDGYPERYPIVAAAAQLTSQFQRDKSTKLLALTISDLVAGDVVRVTCRGKGCRKALTRTTPVTHDRRTLKLPKIAGARLRPKAVLEVTISHPNRVARVYTYTMRAKANPTGPRRVRRCQAPDQPRVPC